MILSVDTETTGADFHHGCKPFMVTACDGSFDYCWQGEVTPYDRSEVIWKQEDLDEIQEYLEAADEIIYHNGNFDIRALEVIGVNAKYWDKTHDTMIASHVLCSGEKHALKYLAFKYLDYYNDEQQKLVEAVKEARAAHPNYDLAKFGHHTMPGAEDKTPWAKLDYWLCPEECKRYGTDDVEMTWLLWKLFKEVMEQEDRYEVYDTRRKLLEITYDIKSQGMYLYADGPNGVKQEIKRLQALRKLLAKRIHQECKIQNLLNFDKEDHIHFFLFDCLELSVYKESEKTGKPSINKESVQYYIDNYPELAPLQHFSDFRKAGTQLSYLSSYLKWVADDGCIHSNLLITGTRITRQASRNPNTQNIDKSLTHIFGPPPGHIWLIYDLVNIELRIWGYSVGNKNLVQIFEDRKSYHNEVCKLFYSEVVDWCETNNTTFKKSLEERYGKIKGGNFNVIYGGGEKKVNNTFCLSDPKQVLHEVDPDNFPPPKKPKIPNAYRKITKVFPEIPDFTQERINEVIDNELTKGIPYITCLGGYHVDIDPNFVYTKACNAFSQGSAGYIIGLSMIELHNNPDYQQTQSRMVNQVHDSIYIQVPIENDSPQLRLSLQKSIEAGGEKLLPTCEAELEKVLYYPGEEP